MQKDHLRHASKPPVHRACPGYTLDRVCAALDSHFNVDELSAEERVYFDDLLSDALEQPSSEIDQAYEEIGRAGGVGDDKFGRLVRGRPNGTNEML